MNLSDLPAPSPTPTPTDNLPCAVRDALDQATVRHTLWQGRRTVWHLWGQGEPVVLLHGGSGSWTHWIRNIEALAGAGRQVLAADMPGCGDSDPPATGHDADALVEPVLAGLHDLLDGAAFDLVGFSFGGLVGGLMSAHEKHRIRRLVIAGAPVLPLTDRPVRLLEWRHLPPEGQRDVHRANLGAMMLFRPDSITDLAIDLHAANLARDRLRRRRLSRTDALARALAQARCPIHAIYGQDDVLYAGQLPELEATLDGLPTLQSRHAIEGAGHWVQFEAPQAFNRELLRVLALPLPAPLDRDPA